MFIVKKILSVLLLPPFAPLFVMLAGLLLMRRRPRTGRFLAWAGLVSALLLSTPAVVQYLVHPLEDIPRPTPQALKSAQAIVILGGGKTTHAPEYGGETVNRLSLERIRYGARLSRQTGLPILVSGGAPTRGSAESVLMRDALEQDFGVKVRWVEDTSLDTRDNARNSAAILKPLGIRRVVLVSHAAHLLRARAEFMAAGFDVVTAPTGFLGGQPGADREFDSFLPGANAAWAGWFACHEWLGYLALKLRAIVGG